MTARVLVVDDLTINAKLLAAKLASEYFEVVTASNGRSALEMAERDPPDVLLLDVMMPRMDGFEVCRRLKASPRTTDIPVVMVTALSDAADRLRGLEAGADDFLTKPINDVALFARVRSLARLKRMMDELRVREQVCGSFGSTEALGGSASEVLPAHVLLVEEHKFAASRIAAMLEPVAHSIARAACRREAQRALGEPVEIIILSLSLPDGDALRLVSQLRAHDGSRDLPILLLANEGDLPRLAKGLDLGANDYLVRPVDRNELLARVRTNIRRKRLQEQLRANYRRSLSLALIDELTGLYNRRYVFAHLHERLARRPEHGGQTAVILFDIDHFKQVNDRYGHLVGDEVLCELACRVPRHVRNVDLVARLGGEEFIIVMPETNLAEAASAAERVRAAVANGPFTLRGGKTLAVTISAGVAVTDERDMRPESLLKRADEALYGAKNGGRNRILALAETRDAA